MRVLIVLLSLTLALAACTKKSEEAPPTPSPDQAAAAPAKVPDAPPAPPPPAVKHHTCDKLVPQALRDKLLAGATITEKQSANAKSVNCKVSGGAVGGDVDMMFMCDDLMSSKEVIDETLKQFQQVKALKYEPLPGLGKAAVQAGDLQVVFWDDDTNCQVTLTGVMIKIKLLDVAKELVAAINPAAIQ